MYNTDLFCGGLLFVRFGRGRGGVLCIHKYKLNTYARTYIRICTAWLH